MNRGSAALHAPAARVSVPRRTAAPAARGAAPRRAGVQPALAPARQVRVRRARARSAARRGAAAAARPRASPAGAARTAPARAPHIPRLPCFCAALQRGARIGAAAPDGADSSLDSELEAVTAAVEARPPRRKSARIRLLRRCAGRPTRPPPPPQALRQENEKLKVRLTREPAAATELAEELAVEEVRVRCREQHPGPRACIAARAVPDAPHAAPAGCAGGGCRRAAQERAQSGRGGAVRASCSLVV
jgi:hypothetical protein